MGTSVTKGSRTTKLLTGPASDRMRYALQLAGKWHVTRATAGHNIKPEKVQEHKELAVLFFRMAKELT